MNTKTTIQAAIAGLVTLGFAVTANAAPAVALSDTSRTAPRTAAHRRRQTPSVELEAASFMSHPLPAFVPAYRTFWGSLQVRGAHWRGRPAPGGRGWPRQAMSERCLTEPLRTPAQTLRGAFGSP